MFPNDRARLLIKARQAAALAVLFLLVGLLVHLVQAKPDLTSLAAMGYPGVTLLMFLSSSTVLFPAPGFAAVLAAGALWNPILVGVAAGLGASTGEITGYLLGLGGGTLLDLEKGRRWKWIHGWLTRYGFWAVLLVASVPNPLFDLVGIVAGSLSYSFRRFWIACLLGNTMKYMALAYLSGSLAGRFLPG